jgi:hypothetical protein
LDLRNKASEVMLLQDGEMKELLINREHFADTKTKLRKDL